MNVGKNIAKFRKVKKYNSRGISQKDKYKCKSYK